MKIEYLSEIIANLAKSHPGADVCVTFPSRHAGRPTTKRGNITGHRTSISTHPAIGPTVFIEVEYARSENITEGQA